MTRVFTMTPIQTSRFTTSRSVRLLSHPSKASTMADADEDTIPRTSPADADDLEDETQDFRFLSQLTSVTRTGASTIPKRGTKDFEPNPTQSQASALDASRLAMHTALSAIRVHAGKSHVVGQYLPDEGDWRWDEDERGA